MRAVEGVRAGVVPARGVQSARPQVCSRRLVTIRSRRRTALGLWRGNFLLNLRRLDRRVHRVEGLAAVRRRHLHRVHLLGEFLAFAIGVFRRSSPALLRGDGAVHHGGTRRVVDGPSARIRAGAEPRADLLRGEAIGAFLRGLAALVRRRGAVVGFVIWRR